MSHQKINDKKESTLKINVTYQIMHTGTWTPYISTFTFHQLDTVTNHGTAKVWIANIAPAICNNLYPKWNQQK